MNRSDFTSEEAYQCYKIFRAQMVQNSSSRGNVEHVDLPTPTPTITTDTLTAILAVSALIAMFLVLGLYSLYTI
jgi:hypothetical protein